MKSFTSFLLFFICITVFSHIYSSEKENNNEEYKNSDNFLIETWPENIFDSLYKTFGLVKNFEEITHKYEKLKNTKKWWEIKDIPKIYQKLKKFHKNFHPNQNYRPMPTDNTIEGLEEPSKLEQSKNMQKYLFCILHNIRYDIALMISKNQKYCNEDFYKFENNLQSCSERLKNTDFPDMWTAISDINWFKYEYKPKVSAHIEENKNKARQKSLQTIEDRKKIKNEKNLMTAEDKMSQQIKIEYVWQQNNIDDFTTHRSEISDQTITETISKINTEKYLPKLSKDFSSLSLDKFK